MQGNAEEAFNLANHYWGTPYYNTFTYPLKEQFFRVNNQYGIPQCCEQDTLWQHFPVQKKDFFKSELTKEGRFAYQDLHELHALRNQLIMRWIQKSNLARLLGIPDAHTPSIDHLIYRVIDQCQNSLNIPGIIQVLSHLSADSLNPIEREAYGYFFNSCGICRFSSTLDASLFQGITFNERINLAAYKDVRQMLNYLTTVDTSTQEAQHFVRQGYKYCSKALDEGALGQAYRTILQHGFKPALQLRLIKRFFILAILLKTLRRQSKMSCATKQCNISLQQSKRNKSLQKILLNQDTMSNA